MDAILLETGTLEYALATSSMPRDRFKAINPLGGGSRGDASLARSTPFYPSQLAGSFPHTPLDVRSCLLVCSPCTHSPAWVQKQLWMQTVLMNLSVTDINNVTTSWKLPQSTASTRSLLVCTSATALLMQHPATHLLDARTI